VASRFFAPCERVAPASRRFGYKTAFGAESVGAQRFVSPEIRTRARSELQADGDPFL